MLGLLAELSEQVFQRSEDFVRQLFELDFLHLAIFQNRHANVEVLIRDLSIAPEGNSECL
ncbi:hypothetical protein BSZ19_00250 [Bradyrhizobium japonicum]|uniref:Uncharacterized protein n=1 Tax=Bradyrhizobium japonicum TaxID=375 RepID=A0A1Y2JYC3_BRAJP|nr:hypothetical protein BSZ19_00250 [Bradyrhizobium japonicum]